MAGKWGINTRVFSAILIFGLSNLVLARVIDLASGVGLLAGGLLSLLATGGSLGFGLLAIAAVGRHDPDLAETLGAALMLVLGWAVSITIVVGVALLIGRLLLWIL